MARAPLWLPFVLGPLIGLCVGPFLPPSEVPQASPAPTLSPPPDALAATPDRDEEEAKTATLELFADLQTGRGEAAVARLHPQAPQHAALTRSFRAAQPSEQATNRLIAWRWASRQGREVIVCAEQETTYLRRGAPQRTSRGLRLYVYVRHEGTLRLWSTRGLPKPPD